MSYINLIRMLSVSYIHEPIALQRNIGVIGDEIEKKNIKMYAKCRQSFKIKSTKMQCV